MPAESTQVEQLKPAAAPGSDSTDPKVASSILRVRVAIGGMAPEDSPAVLLHHLETVGTKTQMSMRYVLTHLPRYEEKQLRSTGCKILVHRNKLDESGTNSGIGFPAWLVRMDAASRLALVGYVDEFPYEDDAGLHIEHNPDGQPLTAIRTYLDPQAAVNGGQGSYTHFFGGADNDQQTLLRWAPFKMESGICQNTEPGGVLMLPEWATRDVRSEATVIMVNDKIVGFAAVDASHQARMIAAGQFDCKAPQPSIAPLSAEFGASGLLNVAAGFDAAGCQPTELHLLSLVVPSEAFYREHFKPAEGNQHAPINSLRSNHVTTLSAKAIESGTASVSLHPAVPVKDGEEIIIAVQLGLVCKGMTMTVSKPWLVKLSKLSDGVYPDMIGLASASNKSGMQKETSAAATVRERHTVPDRQYALESSVRQIRPIKNGKELLFQFDSAPYWKRFSLDKESWLPLPELDLSKVQIAGNQEALFVLTLSSHEVRKYLVDTLQLTETAHLEAGEDHFTLLAGACSSNAPVFVLNPRGVAALSPQDLHRLDVPLYVGSFSAPDRKYSPQEIHETSGDGRSIWTSHGRMETYVDDLLGLQPNYFSIWHHAPDTPCGISGAFQSYQGTIRFFTQTLPEGAKPQALSFDDKSGRRSLIGLDASSPVLFRLQQGNGRAIPPVPTQLAFCFLFDTTPFLEVETPELASVYDGGRSSRGQHEHDAFHQRRCIFLEPESLHLGILAPDRKTWIVRHVASLAKARQPVLLNWPETSLRPGEKTRFHPRILGGGKFQAEIMNRPQAVSTVDDMSTLEIRVSPDEFASLSILNIKLQQQDQSNGPTCQIPIALTGITRPILAPSDLNEAKIKALNSGVSSPDLNPVDVRGLNSRVMVAQEPIVNVVGQVDGFIILQLASHKIQILSLESGTIIQTLSFPPESSFFAGAGGLYHYNRSDGDLCRIEVPEGTRGKKCTIPKGLILAGIGVGKDRDSPLTLLIEGTTDEQSARIGDYLFTRRKYDRCMVVLDNLLNGNPTWAGPVPQEQIIAASGSHQRSNPLGFALFNKEPTRLATSYNGRVINMPGVCCVLGTRFSTWFATGSDSAREYPSFSNATSARSASGSMSGIIIAEPNGGSWKAGQRFPYDKDPNRFSVMLDPSGRYKWIKPTYISSTDPQIFDLRLVETNKLLAKITRLPILGKDAKTGVVHPQRRAFPLNDEGLLALLNPSGHVLQLVDFNYHNAIKFVAKDDLHVISQPQFHVTEGSTLDYQIRVNSPELVMNYRLQTPVEGASLNEDGFLRYVPPMDVKAPAKFDFTIEVKSKSGAVFIHEFPVQILALPKAAPPKTPPPAKVSI